MFWNNADALELIELTYALVDEQEGFNNLFNKIGSLFGEAKFSLQMWDDSIDVDNERIILKGWDTNSVAAYAEHYSSVNPYLPLIGELKSGGVCKVSDLIPVRVSSKHEFLNDFQYVNGNVEAVVSSVLKEDKRTGALAIDGPGHAKQHWDELVALIKVLTPHLQRVMHLSRQLQEVSLFSSIAKVSMDRIAARMIVVDASGRMKFANSSAMDLLSEGGVLKVGLGGFLTASNVIQTQEIRGLISSSTQGDIISTASSGGFMQLKNSAGHKMMAMVAPLGRGIQKHLGLVEAWSAQKNYAVIFLADPGSQIRLPYEMLMMQYDLTKTEASLGLHIYEGGTIADYCEKKYVTSNTARTQLKSIFRKTGVTRQDELIALLNRMTVFAEMGKN